MCRARTTLPVLFLFFLAPSIAPTQESAPGKGIDAAYVSDDFFAAIVVHPGRILKSPALKELPLEAVSAAMKESVGFEPRQIEQVMLLLSLPEARKVKVAPRLPGEPLDPADRRSFLPLELEEIQPGVVIRFKEALANKDLVRRLAKMAGVGDVEDVISNGKTYFLAARIDLAAYVPNDRTLVVAFEPKLKNMLAAEKGKGVLAERLRKADAAHDVIAAVNADVVRKAVERLRAEIRHADDALPIDFFLEIYKHLKGVTFTADIADSLRLQWALDAASAESAELLNDLARGWLAALKVAVPALKVTFAEAGEHDITASIVMGLLEPLTRAAKVKRVEDRVLVQLDFSKEYPTMLAAMARAVAEARQAARRAQSSNNLRQLSLAMHEFHDTFNALPSHASYSKEGKPLLSWRVHILPYLEMTHLWKEFKHDEPWDSPHNKKLITKMPPTFKNPGMELPAGKTSYLVPVTTDKKSPSIFLKGATDKNRGGMEKGVPKEILGIQIGAVADGTSNVIMIVEASPEKAVFWTQPDDWEFNPEKPKDGLFGMWPDFTLAAFADASVHFLPEGRLLTEETLRRLVWREDGNPVELP